MSKCRYCGSGSYGNVYDGRHPDKVHVHSPDSSNPKCIYCGSKSRGNCHDGRHPDGIHDVQ